VASIPRQHARPDLRTQAERLKEPMPITHDDHVVRSMRSVDQPVRRDKTTENGDANNGCCARMPRDVVVAGTLRPTTSLPKNPALFPPTPL